MDNLEFLKARIEALETELEYVRQEKTFLADELRFCNMQLISNYDSNKYRKY